MPSEWLGWRIVVAMLSSSGADVWCREGRMLLDHSKPCLCRVQTGHIVANGRDGYESQLLTQGSLLRLIR